MTEKISLLFQAECCRCAANSANQERAGLEAAQATLEWLNKNAELIRVFVEIRKRRRDTFERDINEFIRICDEHPGVMEMITNFPNAEWGCNPVPGELDGR